MTVLAVLTAVNDSGLSLAQYGAAALPLTIMLGIVRWCVSQMQSKDDVIAKLNERLIVQGDLAVAQAERLAPLITDASRVLNQALTELDPRFKDRSR